MPRLLGTGLHILSLIFTETLQSMEYEPHFTGKETKDTRRPRDAGKILILVYWLQVWGVAECCCLCAVPSVALSPNAPVSLPPMQAASTTNQLLVHPWRAHTNAQQHPVNRHNCPPAWDHKAFLWFGQNWHNLLLKNDTAEHTFCFQKAMGQRAPSNLPA